MRIQGTDIKILKNWCTALELQIRKINEELEKKEPREKQLFNIDEKQKEELVLLRKKQRADILKNLLLLINFDKNPDECNDDDVSKIAKQVRTLVEVAENDKMDITANED